ncbi:MAG: hypothetical protein ACLSHG_00430 [Oscillospiraceae bacterium]
MEAARHDGLFPLNFPLPERTGAEGLDARVTALEADDRPAAGGAAVHTDEPGRENFNPAALERLRAELRSGADHEPVREAGNASTPHFHAPCP